VEHVVMNQASIASAVGVVIQERRKAQGLSLREFARRADINRNYAADIEAGIRNPTIGLLEQMAGALALSLSDLIRAAEQHRDG
jgi:transcriptional regulator with XRE-family HTH domain